MADINGSTVLDSSSLQRYAEIHRNVRAGQDSNTGPHHKSQITAPTPRPRHPTVVQGTAQSLVADSARNNPPSLCILCNGAHFNDQCKQFSSTEDRRRRLHELGRCYICLRPGEKGKEEAKSTTRSCSEAQRKMYVIMRTIKHDHRRLFCGMCTNSVQCE